MADQSKPKKNPTGKRSTNKGRSSKKQIVDAQLSMMDNLSMINVRRFGLKGVDRTAYGDQLKSSEVHEQAAADDDQPSESV